ncbi:MAG: NnrS family protein [Gammaproteobacteria bacterium]|nr:NnrS family protein [Gammaproteobacteria bacterium]MBU1555941.1 NnrS family protein [Gammaproteobacteria bacterium]
MNKRSDLVNIHWPEKTISGKQKTLSAAPVFALAFRPFFLAGASWAILAISLWAIWFSGLVSFTFAFPTALWHAHEMLFGFGAVVAVGFLLTAAQNWTGRPGLSGTPLMLLSMLWLTARFSLLFSKHAPFLWLFMAAQILWWIGAIYSLAKVLLQSRSSNNYLFVPLLSAMALLNTGFVYAISVQEFTAASHLSHAMILMFCMLMSILGGRVIPFFTARALGLVQIKTPLLDRLLLPLSIVGTAMFIAGFFIHLPLKAGWIMLLLGFMHLLRMAFWTTGKIWAVPLLWSLQLAYLALALGLIFLGVSDLTQWLPFKDALHLLSISAMAGMILAMMSRVSLGHTGRLLQVSKPLSVAFVLLLLAGPVRMLATLSGFPLLLWQASAVLWLCAFVIFLWFYLPVLTQPRADGRPG